MPLHYVPFPLQISELGLESSVLPITSSHPAQKNRFIYLNDQGLVLLPNGPSWVFRARPPFSKPLLGVGLAEPFKRGADWSQGRDESVKGFVTRRFNAEVCTASVCVCVCVCVCCMYVCPSTFLKVIYPYEIGTVCVDYVPPPSPSP